MPSNNIWETLKLIRTEYNEQGKAQGVEIRWTRTDYGNLSFSYSFGIVLEAENPDGTDLFKPFKYIPDRFVVEYIALLQEAVTLVRLTMSNSEKSEEGRLTAALLEASVVSNIMRRRLRPVVVNGK